MFVNLGVCIDREGGRDKGIKIRKDGQEFPMEVLARLRECVKTMQHGWKVICVRMAENMNRQKYHLFEQF